MPQEKEPVVGENEIEQAVRNLLQSEEERKKVFAQRWREILQPQTAVAPPLSSDQIHKSSPPHKQNLFLTAIEYFLLFLFLFFIAYFALNYKAYFLKAKYTYTVNLKKQSFPTLPSVPEGEIVNLPDSIIIPKINVDAPIIWQVEDENILKRLNDGVVHFKGTAMPNEHGNVALTGHSSAYPWQRTRYGQVFSLLERLEPKDGIIIIYNKKRYLYEVKRKEIVWPDNVKVLESKEFNLTLITCWPVGTSLKRLVVYAALVNKPKPPSEELLLPTAP